eukprot:tig00000459_g1166.t1
MGIPLGKLDLYVACAGIRPEHTLPVCIDVGTNNFELQHDPLYMGLRHNRVRGPGFDELVAEFVEAVQDKWGPGTLVQFEDFGNVNAFRVLKTFQERGACVFNDDIQGTASVTHAAILSALRMVGGELKDQRILFLGAGEAGTGIGELVADALVQGGMRRYEARPPSLAPQTRPRLPEIAGCRFRGGAGAFSQEVIEAMTRSATAQGKRPLIFALSNPTSKADIFPGVGLAVQFTGAREVPNEMFIVAAEALAAAASDADYAAECLFPPLERIRECSLLVALAVAEVRGGAYN